MAGVCSIRTGCVILADPHLGMLGGIHGLLESSFQTLVMVSNERSLKEAIEKIQPSLLVVDLSLSSSGEANIVQRLHSAHPNIPMVVLSVHDEPSVASVACASGAAGFVIKRNIGTELLPIVKNILRGEACGRSTKVGDV